MTPDQLKKAIQENEDARARILNFLDERGLPHTAQISGYTLATVCGVNARTWRKWKSAGKMPISSERLLLQIAGL